MIPDNHPPLDLCTSDLTKHRIVFAPKLMIAEVPGNYMDTKKVYYHVSMSFS